MHIYIINQNYKYSQDRIHMYKLALNQFPVFTLTSYLIFMTFAFTLTIIIIWTISPKFKWR